MTYKPANNDSNLMARNLSFNRSIAPSPSLLIGFDSAHPDRSPEPIILQSVKGRGAFLNHYLGKDFDPSKPNIVEGDIANLPPDCDSFRMDFSVNVTAGSIKPNTCELPVVDRLIQDISAAYAAKLGYQHLAERYVWRLLTGSMMGRNYTVSSDKKVVIMFEVGEARRSVSVQCRDLSKTKYPGYAALRDVVPQVDDVIAVFAKALSIDGDPLILRVSATGIVGYGGEVYPSQLFIEDRTLPKKLASYPLGDGRLQGKITATKIGNAIRHIDEWYGDADAAIAVEAYGFVQRNLSARRPKQEANFYNLLWQDSPNFLALINESKSAAVIPSNIHYFMAMLIRGGVFAAPSASASTKAES